jgi:hypothetical protein
MFREFIMSGNLTENLLVQENKYIISQVESAIKHILSEEVIIPNVEEVHNYLIRYPDIIELVEFACNETRKRFNLPTQLSLEVYHDPEIDDEYLTLYVRQEKYDYSAMDIIQKIRTVYREEYSIESGYFIVTTDFNFPK